MGNRLMFSVEDCLGMNMDSVEWEINILSTKLL